jgi:hypothetical protein
MRYKKSAHYPVCSGGRAGTTGWNSKIGAGVLVTALLLSMWGCSGFKQARKGERFRFEYLDETSYPKEQTPARVTTLSEEELVSQGFVKIAKLELTYSVRKEWEDGEVRDYPHEKTLEEVFLERAAEMGAQLVTWIDHGVEQKEVLSKRGECISGHYETSIGHYETVWKWDPYRVEYVQDQVWVPGEREWVCDEYEYIKGAHYFTVSVGDLWRRR